LTVDVDRDFSLTVPATSASNSVSSIVGERGVADPTWAKL